MIQKGLAASQIVLFGPIVPLFLMQDRLRPGEGPPGGWGNRGDGGDHGGDYRPPEDDYEMPDYEVPDWGDYVPPEWPSRRLQDVFDQQGGSDFIPFGDPSLVTDIILASFIATFFYSVSVFCDFEKATNLKLALLSATLLFFAMVDGFNAIRAQDRFGSDYSDTKKNTKDANARANALAALIFIQFVLSLAQVWVASTRLRLAKKANEPASKAETEGSFEGEVASKEPSAEESAPEKSSGCVAS